MASAGFKSLFQSTGIEQLEKHEQHCTHEERVEPMMIGDEHEEPTVIAHDMAMEDQGP
jgi:hypothetical protein